MAVFEELFNDSTPIFKASLVPELLTCLLEHSEHEQTVVGMSIRSSHCNRRFKNFFLFLFEELNKKFNI